MSLLPQPLRCSLAFARIDAVARRRGVSLFADVDAAIPPSQRLFSSAELLDTAVLEELLDQGFTHVKLKVGRDALADAAAFTQLAATPPGKRLRWRLDANGAWDAPTFESFVASLGAYASAIDFIEDPTPFCPQLWRRWQRLYPFALAADRYATAAWGDAAAAAVLVLKPAITPLTDLFAALLTPQRCIVTSYLDHPLGQLSASWCAALLYRSRSSKADTCGLLTHHCYLPHSFSSAINDEKCKLIPALGNGFGCSHLLEQQSWIPLK